MMSRFEWDDGKEAENLRKHGVGFSLAREAFLDPRRVIARDLAHSNSEDRFILLRRGRRWSAYRTFHLQERHDSNHRRRILAQR